MNAIAQNESLLTIAGVWCSGVLEVLTPLKRPAVVNNSNDDDDDDDDDKNNYFKRDANDGDELDLNFASTRRKSPTAAGVFVDDDVGDRNNNNSMTAANNKNSFGGGALDNHDDDDDKAPSTTRRLFANENLRANALSDAAAAPPAASVEPAPLMRQAMPMMSRATTPSKPRVADDLRLVQRFTPTKPRNAAIPFSTATTSTTPSKGVSITPSKGVATSSSTSASLVTTPRTVGTTSRSFVDDSTLAIATRSSRALLTPQRGPPTPLFDRALAGEFAVSSSSTRTTSGSSSSSSSTAADLTRRVPSL